MTSRADELREKAERLAARQQKAASKPKADKPKVDEPTAEDRERHLAAAAPVRATPVRRTVDLSPTHHAQLTSWCAETAQMIGVSRVTGQDVLRALVGRLLTDETLARKVRDELLAERQ